MHCQILVSTPEGAGSLPWRGLCSQTWKIQGQKAFFCLSENSPSGARQFVAKDPQDDDDLKLLFHTMMPHTRVQVEGRMIVTALAQAGQYDQGGCVSWGESP